MLSHRVSHFSPLLVSGLLFTVLWSLGCEESNENIPCDSDNDCPSAQYCYII